MIDPMPN